jgi:hypothetical protein
MTLNVRIVRGCLGLLRSTFFSQTVSAPRTLFKKKGGVVRAPREVLHKLQFFMELPHGGVCGAIPNTLSIKVVLTDLIYIYC